MFARRRRLLVLGAGLALAAPLPAQITGHSSIRGTITSPDGRPLAGARIVRFGTTDTARADSLGHYAVERLALGRHLFVVRQSGFQPVEMEVTFTNDTSITVDVPLEPAHVASTAKLDRVGFTERRRRAAAGNHEGATFLGPEEIAGRSATVSRTSLLLEGVPGITIRREQNVFVAYGYDARCVMNVWVEGRRAENVFPPQISSTRTAYLSGVTGGRGASPQGAAAISTYPGLDNLLQPDQIAAIEIYPRPTSTPALFQAPQQPQLGTQFETRSADCGAIVIWTNQEP